MNNYFGYIIVLCLVFSCNSSEKTETKVTIIDGAKKYDVYQPSEMSNLMKGMYAYNMQIKKDIEDGKIPTEFPEEFLNIHSAQLSETKSRNETFSYFSTKYIDAQKLVFIEDTSSTVTQRYNNAINLCLSCHKSECTGPIPKIKKLLIK